MEELLKIFRKVGIDTENHDCFQRGKVFDVTKSFYIRARRSKEANRIIEVGFDSDDYSVIVLRVGKNTRPNWDMNCQFLGDVVRGKIVQPTFEQKLAAALYEEKKET